MVCCLLDLGSLRRVLERGIALTGAERRTVLMFVGGYKILRCSVFPLVCKGNSLGCVIDFGISCVSFVKESLWWCKLLS